MSVIAPLSLHSLSTMSKDNMLLGYARGKVGSLVFARRAGVQITRAYNANPANPRTIGQSAQRMLMSTAIQAYRNMAVICDHSFENAIGKQGNMRAFMKEALKNLRADHSQFAYQYYGQTQFYPGNYLISRGSLNPLAPFELEMDGGSVVLKLAGITPGTSTYQAVAAALGLEKIGDIATICIIYPTAIGGNAFTFIRLTLTDDIPEGVTPATGTYDFISIDKPAGVVCSGSMYSDNAIAAPHIKLSAAPMSYFTPGVDYIHNAVISSHLRDGVWYRSTTRFAGVVETDAYDLALATWPANDTPVLNGGNV